MFDEKNEVDNIIKFIRKYYRKNNLGGIVIGISGGKDSAVVSGLFSKAIGSDNIIGVFLPCNSDPKDYIDAKSVADKFGFKLIKFDLINIYNAFLNEANKLAEYEDSDDSLINLKPRLRMSSLYFLAQTYSKINNKTYLVAGTSNKSEQFVGYFTKGGDNVSDINLLTDFTVDEVVKIGKYLEVPKEVLYKKPSDGLSGKTDEENFGFSYKDIAKVINKEKVNSKIKEKILARHNQNKHKFKIPAYKKERVNI